MQRCRFRSPTYKCISKYRGGCIAPQLEDSSAALRVGASFRGCKLAVFEVHACEGPALGALKCCMRHQRLNRAYSHNVAREADEFTNHASLEV